MRGSKTAQANGTADAAAADAREARTLSAAENADLCAGCIRCCSYITVEIDAPRAAWEYDQWIWALHHRGISLYVERPEAWYVHVETRCERLDAHGRCSIHGRHPVLCRDYDPRSCERRLPLTEMRAWFDTADELEEWIRVERPRHWERLLAFRRAAGEVTPPTSRPNGTADSFIPLASVTKALVLARGPAAAPRMRRGART